MAQPAQAPMPADQAQGAPQGSAQVSPEQAMSLIQAGIQGLGKFMQSGQADPDLARDFQTLQSAFQDFAESAQQPAGAGQGAPQGPGGPMPEHAGSSGTPGANY